MRFGREGNDRREPVRRARFALALAVTAVVPATAVALGGVPAAVDLARGVLNFNATSSRGDNAKTSAHNEFEERVTICQRAPGSPDKGRTRTLPRPAAEAYLRDHGDDDLGPCPPPRGRSR